MSSQPAPLAFATDLAQQAGAILLEHFHRREFQPTLKPDRSVVTDADTASDRFIAAALNQAFPEDRLLSEELNPRYSQTEGEPPASGLWIIDPLDGTTNFAVGLHFWGVLLARLVNGIPDTSVMYFPLLNELYTAQRGQGAYFNHQPLKVRPPGELSPLSFFACCSRTHRRYEVGLRYKTRILGSTAYTLCAVARSLAIIGFEATPKIWDLAAPWLLVEEAGGAIRPYGDTAPFPLNPSLDFPQQSFPVVAAATAELADEAMRRITPREPQSLQM